MNAYGLKFHHLGLAVRHPDAAMGFLKGLGYRLGVTVYDPLQNVNLCMCHADEFPDVEMIWEAEGKSPVDGMLSKRGALVYHVCYSTDDLGGTLGQIEQAGHRIIELSPPKPAVLFDGLTVSFYEIAGFGTIELLHTR